MNKSFAKKLLVCAVVLGAFAVALKIKDTYFDVVDVTQVRIVGAPCPTGRLETTIWIHAETGGFAAGRGYTGGGPTTPGVERSPLTIGLPVDGTVEVRVRIGTCRAVGGHWDCQNPAWLGGVQIVTVDTEAPSPEMLLGFPGEHACRASS
jgi:hypothetical protein